MKSYAAAAAGGDEHTHPPHTLPDSPHTDDVTTTRCPGCFTCAAARNTVVVPLTAGSTMSSWGLPSNLRMTGSGGEGGETVWDQQFSEPSYVQTLAMSATSMALVSLNWLCLQIEHCHYVQRGAECVFGHMMALKLHHSEV